MTVKNIVFSGGGFKGWAYIGTIRALNELIPYRDIEHIIGVSVGSLFGLMYLLQVDYNFLLDFIMNLNFKEILDVDIDNIMVNQSLLSGNKFMEILKTLVSVKIDPESTFSDLRKYSKVMYTVNALNINDSKLEYFNYQLTPHVKIVDAIRASCSLPFLLPCYSINNKNYFDGGLCNNLPVDLLTENDTIAFDVSYTATENNTNVKLVDLLNALVNISNEKYSLESKKYIIHQIIDSRFKDQLVNLNQSKDDIFNIYMTGYRNSKEMIFKNCIALM
jgi:NTE family protein